MVPSIVNLLHLSSTIRAVQRVLNPHSLQSSRFANAVWAPLVPQCRHYSFFQLDKVFSLKRLKEERLRLQDEMERGYFDDIKDLKKNLGKLDPASRGLLPVANSATFPVLLCRAEDGSKVVIQDAFRSKDVTLACVAFRQNAQPMVDSWNLAFEGGLRSQAATQLIELSVVESIFLRPFQSQLVKSMSALRKRTAPVKAHPPNSEASPKARHQVPPNASRHSEQTPSLMRQNLRDPSAPNESVPDQSALKKSAPKDLAYSHPAPEQLLLYHFADTWSMRRALNMPNRLTAYALLVDSEGRVRWRATGLATEEEATSLQRATRLLLSECAQRTARAKRAGGDEKKGEETENRAGGEAEEDSPVSR